MIKLGKEDIGTPDPAIRVRISYKSDLTLHLSMVLVVSRNGEPSLMPSIIIRTHGMCMYSISTKLRSLRAILMVSLRTIGLRLKSRELSLLYGRNMLNIFITSSLTLRIAGITYI